MSLDEVRTAVEATLPPRSDETPELILYDQAARKALELTFRQALAMGHNYIGTEHILLALLDDPDSTGATALVELGLERTAVEGFIAAALDSIK